LGAEGGQTEVGEHGPLLSQPLCLLALGFTFCHLKNLF
jgi:hypothetical protein